MVKCGGTDGLKATRDGDAMEGQYHLCWRVEYLIDTKTDNLESTNIT